jgi:hypothetical protein
MLATILTAGARVRKGGRQLSSRATGISAIAFEPLLYLAQATETLLLEVWTETTVRYARGAHLTLNLKDSGRFQWQDLDTGSLNQNQSLYSMKLLLKFPAVMLALSLVLLCLSKWLGSRSANPQALLEFGSQPRHYPAPQVY